MNIFSNPQNQFVLGEWALAIGVLLLTIPVNALVKSTFKKFSLRIGPAFLKGLLPWISGLIWVTGLLIFNEAAPLHQRISFLLGQGLYIAFVLMLLGFLRRAAFLSMDWGVSRTRSPESLKRGFVPLCRNLVTVFVFLTGLVMVLKHLNYDVMSLVAALGVGSLAVGLAAQPTLANMISGFILIIDRNLRAGDYVSVAGLYGVVEWIGLRSTQIKMDDGNMLIVPNAELVNTKILNMSLHSRDAVCSSHLRIPHTIPFSSVRDASLEILSHLSIKNHSPFVRLTGMSDGYQNITISFRVEDALYVSPAVSELNEKFLMYLHRVGFVTSCVALQSAPRA